MQMVQKGAVGLMSDSGSYEYAVCGSRPACRATKCVEKLRVSFLLKVELWRLAGPNS